MLDVLDLDPVEQAVYEILVEGPPQTVEDLAGALSVSADVLRRAVETMVTKHLITRVPGRPSRYAAVSPATAFEQLFTARERSLTQAREYVEQLLARFHQAAGGRDPAELVEIVTGRPLIRQRWMQLQRSAREQLRVVDKPPYAVPAQDNIATESDMLAKGVRCRAIYDSAGLIEFHDLRTDVAACIGRGEEARVMNDAPTKLGLIDDQAAILPLEPAPARLESMVIVHPSGLLEALGTLFEHLWRLALPLRLSGEQPGSADQPTPDELRLLSLLASGATDEAIAAHLGLAHRTYQRRLRALLDRLGANTRFQAGMQATLRGWLSATPPGAGTPRPVASVQALHRSGADSPRAAPG
ncbi:helix-turn-helix domain-containing protein [Krasilnikovia sp. MM14-A1004]|uniref:helix-turn-helix domain-containing protein n=1 Tax=Krasilnikovia sp. MM14-A1004 TaxID=3373541 RepID=UPI00399C5C22